MKTNRPILRTDRARPRAVDVVAAVLFALASSAKPVHAQPAVHEIAVLPGFTSSAAYGVNNAGVVCGKSYTSDDDDVAQLWSAGAGAVALPALPGSSESGAWSINEGGQLSGFSRTATGDRHAVRWDDATTIVDLGTLVNPDSGAPGIESTAYSISADGSITGSSDIPNSSGDFMPFHAVVSDGDNLVDLGTLNTTLAAYQYGYSIAYETNRNGETVGIAHDNDLNFRPFIHDAVSGMVALPIDSTYPDGEWYATTINDDGLIGGSVILGTGRTLPYYWPSRASVPSAVSLPQAFPNGEIYSVNSFGQMIGIMWSDDAVPDEHAFIFDKVFGVRDLNDLIDSSTGWILRYARHISDNGLIVGSGEQAGRKRGYLIDSLNLSRTGDVTNDGSVDLADALTALLVTAGSSDLPVNRLADVNDDSRVGLAEAVYALTHSAGL